MLMTVFRPMNTVINIVKMSSACFCLQHKSPTSKCYHFLEITRLFSEDDFAENNCFDGKNLYAYPCRGKCFQYIGLYESNVIYDFNFIILLTNLAFFMNYFKWKMFTNLIVKQFMIDAIESSNVDAQQIIILT